MPTKLRYISVVAALLLLVFAASHDTSRAAEWGSLKGRLIVDGTPAALPPLAVGAKDPFCAMAKPVNETIVLGKDNALVNGVVFLRVPNGQKIDIHADYDAKFKLPVEIDNKGCAFRPRISMARVDQMIWVKNSDPTGHNINITLFGLNQVVPQDKPLEVKAKTALTPVVPIECNIHPFMKGYVVTLAHPYMAVTGDDGTFEIKNIPAGTHEFKFWQETGGWLDGLKVKGNPTDKKGAVKLTIPANQTLDLGDIKVPVAALK